MAGEKTEKASPKRKRDERKKGNVFQSKDAVAASSILAVFFVIKLLAPWMVNYMANLIRNYFAMGATVESYDVADSMRMATNAIMQCVVLSIGPLLAASLAGVIASGAQTKFLFSMDSLKPKFSKLNPLSGIKNMFSMRALVELMKNLIKVVVIGFVVYNNIGKKFSYLPNTMTMDVLQAGAYIASAVWDIVVNISIIFVFIAAADFGFQWWDYEKKLRMSKQEVKEEYKQMEGDPQIKGKIKEKQRAMAMNRMMQSVPEADVVIRNPTHFAVAIAYDTGKNNAPMVLAKGQDRVALKIIEVAEKHGVMTMENRALARALYAQVEIGQEVPPDFYQPVAEVLAYVYNLNKKEL